MASVWSLETLWSEKWIRERYGISDEEAKSKAIEILVNAGFSRSLAEKSADWDEFVYGLLGDPDSAARFYKNPETERLQMSWLRMYHTS